MDPAQASVEPEEQGGEAPVATGYIPIDIGDVVPTEHKYEYLSIRVENVPLGAKLSAGQDNGDESWSLAIPDLENLVYIPSRKGVDSRSLIVRIVGVKGGFGEAVASVEVPIGPDDIVQGTYEAPAASTSIFGAGGGMAAAFQAEIDSEVARQLAAQKAAWQKELQSRLAEQAKAHEEALGTGVNAERAAELQSLIADAEARVQMAEQAAQEASEAMAHAMARAEAAEAEAASFGMNEEAETLREQLMAVRRELSGVRATMRVRSGSVEEIQKEVHDSLQDEFAHQLEELHERYGRELERLTKLATSATASAPAPANAADSTADTKARLAEARRQWEQEIAAKLASVENATKKAIREGRETAVAEAREQWEQEFQGRLAEAQAEWQASQLGAAPESAPEVDSDAVVKQAIAARDKQWKAEFDRRITQEREAWQAAQPAQVAGIDEDAVARRIEAARQEWEAAQPASVADVDEEEVARRIEAARQEWLEGQNSLIEMRDREWQAELDRRVGEEHERLVAAQAAIATSGAADGDPEALAAMQQEWAQSQTLEIERRLLEAEDAWAAKDEERLQAARAAWEAEQQQMLAERDEKWKLEIVRQLDEARHAWKQGVEDHTPELEMPVVAIGEAPVGVPSDTVDETSTEHAREVVEDQVPAMEESLTPVGEEVVLDGEFPSFFEEHPEEAFADRELGLQGRRDLPEEEAEEEDDDGSDDIVPEWMEEWADRLRIPPHWVPRAHRFGRRVKRLGRSAWSKLRKLIAGQIAARRAATEAKKAGAAQAGAPPADSAAAMAAAGVAVAPTFRRGFRGTALFRALQKAGQLGVRLVRVLMKIVGAILARAFRLAFIAGVIALLYHGYYWVKPKVYPHLEPYVASYWDPYVGPYVRVYWDPYVQPYIDTYWGGYAKPHIVGSWNTYVEPYVDSAWRTTKSLADDALDGIMGLLPDAPPPPEVGASVSKGKSTPTTAPLAKPKLSGVAQRLYLTQPSATLRADANKYSAAIGTVRQSDFIQRLGLNGGWVKIRIVSQNMKIGWVPGGLLSDAPAEKQAKGGKPKK